MPAFNITWLQPWPSQNYHLARFMFKTWAQAGGHNSAVPGQGISDFLTTKVIFHSMSDKLQYQSKELDWDCTATAIIDADEYTYSVYQILFKNNQPIKSYWTHNIGPPATWTQWNFWCHRQGMPMLKHTISLSPWENALFLMKQMTGICHRGPTAMAWPCTVQVCRAYISISNNGAIALWGPT